MFTSVVVVVFNLVTINIVREEPYYSVRTGANVNPLNADLQTLLKLFRGVYRTLHAQGFFQEAFGYNCKKRGNYVLGTLGQEDIRRYLSCRLNKTGLWPIAVKCLEYTEDDLFDVIEFLYDNTSQPTGEFRCDPCGRFHKFQFSGESGKRFLRTKMNDLICVYKHGYELSTDGEVLTVPDAELRSLLEDPIPIYDARNVNGRIDVALRRFRNRHATLDDKHVAVRDLVDVLEFLKPKLKEVLTKKDESDLFNIANNFGIRHHNSRQRTNYDRDVWIPWLFSFYYSTIHAVLRRIKKEPQTLAVP